MAGSVNNNKSGYMGSNPIVDAALGGGISALAIGGYDYYSQSKAMKNPEAIAKLKQEVDEFVSSNPERSKEAKRILGLFEKGKIDWKGLGNKAGLAGIGLGALFLIANGLYSFLNMDKSKETSPVSNAITCGATGGVLGAIVDAFLQKGNKGAKGGDYNFKLTKTRAIWGVAIGAGISILQSLFKKSESRS